MMKCQNCGKEFEPKNSRQKYCCAECRISAAAERRRTGTAFPSIEFDCARCGKHVVTDGKKDKRKRFCSQFCQDRYWKHPHHKKPETEGKKEL